MPAVGTSKAPLALGQRGVQLQTLDDLLRFANLLVASNLAPKGDGAETIVIKIQCGLEVGLPAMQALNYVAVVGNRPSIWGQGAQGLILSSGALERLEERFEETQTEGVVSYTLAWRRGFPTPFEGRFSEKDAEDAGLLKKETYRGYLKDMLRWRSRSRCYDAGFSDVLGGLPIAEVAKDVEVEVPPAPADPGNGAPKAKKPKTIGGLAARMAEAEPVDAEFAELGENTPPERVQAQLEAIKKVEADVAREKAERQPAPTPAQVEHEAAVDKAIGRTKKKAAPEPQEPVPTVWYPKDGDVLEVPYAVNCGFWESWCDERLPTGNKLFDLCAAKGAPTWRVAAGGATEGGRAALLRRAVEHAQKLLKEDKDGQSLIRGITEAHMRAACALAMLTHRPADVQAVALTPNLFGD